MTRTTLIGAIVTSTLLVSTGCDPVALAPTKVHAPATGADAQGAKEAFWNAFSGGHYDQIGEVKERLTAAYLEAPEDAELALLSGHVRLWRLAERARLAQPPATITDDAAVAVHYFKQAATMRPDDGRIPGWLGGVTLALADINHDERLKRQGYFTLVDAAETYPEFNYFTLSLVMSSLPRDHERWAEVVDAMWEGVDACAGKPVNRNTADYALFASEPLEQADSSGPRRVCWNNAKAVHNFEGFFLHNGDVLTKNLQPELAVAMYNNAKLSRTYDSWPYRDVLEERITSAATRADNFRRNVPSEMMIDSAFSCTGCHQR